MHQGDIYLVDLNPTLGKEQQGTRPVLIVSQALFNQKTKLPIIVPITTGGNSARLLGLTVSLMGAGTKTTGVIRCDQLRSLDLTVRNARKLESVPDYIIQEVLAKLIAIFEYQPMAH